MTKVRAFAAAVIRHPALPFWLAVGDAIAYTAIAVCWWRALP